MTPHQAEAVFDILVNDLDVDPQNRPLFLHACSQGAESIQVKGFLQGPKCRQPRLIVMANDPRLLRCHQTDERKLKAEQRARLAETRWRLMEVMSSAQAAIEVSRAAVPAPAPAMRMTAARRVSSLAA